MAEREARRARRVERNVLGRGKGKGRVGREGGRWVTEDTRIKEVKFKRAQNDGEEKRE